MKLFRNVDLMHVPSYEMSMFPVCVQVPFHV